MLSGSVRCWMDRMSVNPLSADLFADGVAEHEQQQRDDRLQKADCGCVAVAPFGNAIFIDIGVQHLAARQIVLILEYPEMLDTVIEQAADGENEEQRDGGSNRGYGDIADLVPAVGAVDPGGLVHLLRDGGDGGHIDDRSPAHALDERGDDDQSPEVLLSSQNIDLFPDQTQVVEHGVDKAGVIVQKAEEDAAENRPGNEVREKGDRLHGLFEAVADQLAGQDGKDDRTGKVDQQLQDIQAQRVEHDIPEVRIVDELLEVVQAVPVCLLNGLQNIQISVSVLEGEHQAVERRIREHGQKQHAQRRHAHEHPVARRPGPAFARCLTDRFACRDGGSRLFSYHVISLR